MDFYVAIAITNPSTDDCYEHYKPASMLVYINQKQIKKIAKIIISFLSIALYVSISNINDIV